jgi:hypothetical protein
MLLYCTLLSCIAILFNVHFEVTLAKTIAGVIITGDQLPVTATPLAIIYF